MSYVRTCYCCGVGRRVSQTPAAPQPPTPFTYSKACFCMRVKGARECTDHTNPKTTTNKTEAVLFKCNRCRPDHVFVVGHACTSTHIMAIISQYRYVVSCHDRDSRIMQCTLVLGARDLPQHRSCLCCTIAAKSSIITQSSSNHHHHQ